MMIRMSPPRRLAGPVATVLSLLTICTAAARDVSLPPANQQFDYQLGGVYTPTSSVGIVVRDRLASPAAGKYNIPGLHQNPEISRVDDMEVIGDKVSQLMPLAW
ncbi:MAG: secreted protein [Proteobacteria bacterium]|nr:secreted protein [Pseudomonadota bacterium]